MKARTTLLMFRRICAPPELSIRIFDPITSYFVIASFILHLNLRYFKRIRRSLYYIPAERRSAGTLVLLIIIDRNTLKKSTRHLTLTPITTLTTLTTKTEDMKARTTLLMCRRICAPPELSIRIFDPITSYFVIASFILHLNQRYFKRIRRSLYYIPAERRSAGTLVLLIIIDRNTLKKSTRHLTLTTITTETEDMKASTTLLMFRRICAPPELSIRIS